MLPTSAHNTVTLLYPCLQEIGITSAVCADCTASSRETDKILPTVYSITSASDPDGNGVLEHSLYPSTCPEGYFFNAAESVRECEKIVPDTNYCKDLCSPCALQCQEPGTMLPSPTDCQIYKICLDNGVLDVSCPPEYPNYNFETSDCTNDDTVCYNLCDPCEVYCVAEGKIPDPKNCNGYLYCHPPEVAYFLCPEGEAFNSDLLLCEPFAGNCTNTC
nr:peritrophin-48-like [Cherax quadricarinatus]